MKQLSAKTFQLFNTPDTVLVISKYPYDGVSHSYHGVATYTRHLLRTIVRQTGKRFVVLVEKEYGRDLQFDEHGKILILPTFDGNFAMFPQLLRQVLHFNRVQVVHVHSEFYTSGRITQMAATLPFLFAIRAAGKKLHYIAHNVVSDFSFMARHLGKKQADLKLRISEMLLPLYYRALAMCVSTLVVLDESVRQKLVQLSGAQNTFLSPHWIYPKRITTRQRQYWRHRLGFKKHDKVLVCFGFMTRYKGADWLVDTITQLQTQPEWQHLRLILAGGKAPSQTGKKHYEQFYRELEQKVQSNPKMMLTGFIPERDISRYFSVADLVVLPYRGILGASGSWAQTMAHGKPFALSEDLQPYLDDQLLVEALEKTKLHSGELVFRRSKQHFAQFLRTTLSARRLSQISKLSTLIAAQRSPERRLREELEVLYTPATKTQKSVPAISRSLSLD